MTSVAPAIVVGLCGHGLAISRALATAGYTVIGLEANQKLPGFLTNSATVRQVSDINGVGLLDELRSLHRELGSVTPLPLFLTNDRMVRLIGEHWDALDGLYRLSWSGVRNRLAEFLDKKSIEVRCAEVGLNYPKSCVINGSDNLRVTEDRLGFPFIVKPVKPLSSFKVCIVRTPGELNGLVEKFPKDLPFLAQQWIPGDDRSIFFGALYLKNGEVLARFEGHKLYSRPMGHTTLAEPVSSEEIHQLTLKFYEGLRFSGPVSLELKQDPAGKLWVIEPTVGRTDFWVGLCIENGVNLPLIEYLEQIENPIPPMYQVNRAVWVNGERDPFWLLRLLCLKPMAFIQYRLAFLYCCFRDPKPYVRSTTDLLISVINRAISWFQKGCRKAGDSISHLQGGFSAKKTKILAPAQFVVTRYVRLGDIPSSSLSLFEAAERKNFSLAIDWFDLLSRTALKNDESMCIYATQKIDAEKLARVEVMLPLCAHEKKYQLHALANFYTALYSPIASEISSDALRAIFVAIRDEGWNRLTLNPLAYPSIEFDAIEEAFHSVGWVTSKHFCFGNWYLPIAIRSYEDYFRNLPAKLRHTIERKRKKLLSALEGRLEIITGGVDLERGISDYQKVYAASWKKPEPFPAFIPELMRMSAAKGQLRLGLVYIGGTPAAAQIWIVKFGIASIYKLAYDQKFVHHSLGSVLEDHLMRHSIEVDCVNEVDYLIGDDLYKRDWMSHRRERWGIVAYNPRTFRGKVGVSLECGRRCAKRLIGILQPKKKYQSF